MSGMIPEQNDKHEHVYSLIADGLKKKVIVRDENGKPHIETVLDEKKAWLKTGIVPSPHYGSYTFDAEELNKLADSARKYMPQERADDLAQDIVNSYESFCNGIDSLSSMTLRDKHNSQACLIDKGFRQKSERDIRIIDDAKRSFMDAITGKEKHEATRE